jgi:ADP-L-glycero-D-manno-heptose 6-epimerase
MIYQLYRQMKAGKRPRVFKAGEHKRDFVYVKDVVAMTIAAVGAPRSDIFNCGSGHPFSFNEVIAELNRCLGTSLEPEYFENPYSFYQPHTEADMAKARNELNFSPQYPPGRGIADYLGLLEGAAI